MKKAIVPLGILILVIFGVFMYINRFTIFHTSDIDGIVFATNDMATNLTAGINDDSPKITYENVKVNETIYKSGKKFYIGEETKKNVNLDYPIVSTDTSSLLILNDKGNFVDDSFVKSATYENTILNEGTLYNGVNNSKVSDDKYIFLEVGNGIYVNLVELNVKRNGEDHKIPVNSFIYFEQSFLRFYTLKNGVYKFTELAGVLDTTETIVDETKYDYYDFLVYLGIIVPKEEKQEEIIEEILTPEEQQEEIQAETKPPTGIIVPNEPYNPGNNYAEGIYIKPEARIRNTSTNVYSYKGYIEIYDPAQKITKSPTIEFKIRNQVKLRFMYNKSMDFEAIGLEPDTEYEVEAYFLYYGADGKKYKTTFFTESIKSKDISNLETLKLVVDDIEPGMKMVKLGTLKLNNKKGDEVLKGLKFGTLSFNNIHIQMSQGIIMNLADLKTEEYETGESLATGTAYHGKIVFEDIAGNELKVTGNEFDFETLKTPPIAKIGVELSNNFTLAKAQIELTNPDRVEASRYRYALYEYNTQEIIQSDSLYSPETEKNQNVNLINLNAETKYVFRIYCDYIDSATGKLIKDYLIEDYTFTTFDAARLGIVKFDIQELQITQNEISIRAKFLQYSDSNPVFGLMEENLLVTLTNVVDPNESITQLIPKNEFIAGKVIDFINLTSNTTYELTIEAKISSGCDINGNCNYYPLPTSPEVTGYTTDKAAAVVHVENGFVASKYVDFDVCIEDPDESISRDYPVQILFKKVESGNPGTIVDTHEIMPKDSCTATTTDDSGALVNVYEKYDRIIASEKLEVDKTYQINIFAQEYNTKHTLNTKTTYNQYINDLKVSGTRGDLKIIGLTNEVNYKLNEDLTCDVMGTTNLFDISNNSRWKTTTGGESKEDKEIKIDDNELILKAYRGYSAYSYYLPELQGRSYSIKYDYEYEQGTSGDRVSIVTSDDFTGGSGINAHTAADSGSARHVILSQTGKYLTFYVTANEDIAKTSTIKLKNIQINCNTTDDSIEYENFGGEANTELYVGEFYAYFENLMEKNLNDITYPENFNEKEANEYKYYVNYYLNGEKLEEAEGDSISVDNLLPLEGEEIINQNLIKREITGNQNLEARLGVSTDIGGITRYYDLKVVKFSSEAETRTIKTAQDFMDMHAYGYYILDLEDQPNTCTLPENQEGSCISLTGKTYAHTFQGSIDFQGNKVEVITTGVENTNSGLFNEIGGGGVIKNLNLHMHIGNTVPEGSLSKQITSYYGVADKNNGTISNIKVTFSGFYQPRTFYNKWEYDNEQEKDVLTKEWIVDLAHSGFSLISKTNSGTIENFLIDMQSELIVSGSTGLVALTNNGTIKNGYVIGENINAGYSTGTSGVGIIASSSNSNSRITNVYSLIDIVVQPPKYDPGYKIKYNSSQLDTVDHLVPIENSPVTSNQGAGIVYSANSAFIENALVVDPRIVYHEYDKYNYETNRTKSVDPMIINGGSSTVSNLNYIGKDTFRKEYHEVAIISHLKEGEFMEETLNSDGMFNTKEASSIGQLPRLLWDECMPSQDIIKIPEYSESDRLKILSVNTVTQATATQKFNYDSKDYKTEVKFSIYNPQNFKIVGLELDGFKNENVKVVGRSGINAAKQEMITLYINAPENYKKNYDIKEIYINEQTAGNEIGVLTKTCKKAGTTILDSETEFDCESLPYLTLDLYLEVDTISEAIDEATTNNHENFSLTQDIDFADEKFKHEPTSIDNLSVTINGNGHKIKNLTTGNCYIKNFTGELKNLHFENYKVEYENDLTNYAGVICKSQGGVIDNVHIKDEELLATAWDDEYGGNPWSTVYIGGIVAYSQSTIIKNSSVTNVHLPEINNDIPGAENRSKDYAERAGHMDAGVLTIGGLTGYASSTDITNSFARKVKFALNTYEEGVDNKNFTDFKFGFTELYAAGGLVGELASGKIENVYATGTIDSKIGSGQAYIGGLIGRTSAKISSAISYVNVYAVTLDAEEGNLGGMIGNTTNAYGNVASKSLVLGDVLTSIATDQITKYRTSGTPIQANKNFAWYRQAMNSQVSANTSNEELLNDEDLSNPAIYSTKIGLSSNDFTLGLDNYRKVAYDKDDNIYEVSYDTPLKEVEKEEESFEVVDLKTGETIKVMEVHGTIPKLLHSETGEVLSNQDIGLDTVINYVELFSISEIEKITYIDVDPSADGNSTDYTYQDTLEAMKIPGNYGVVNYLGRVVEVVAYIRNPNKLQITDMEIEDMDILNLDIAQTSYDLTLYQAKIYAKAKPNKNKDSYNITCINYRLQGEDLSYRATIKFDVSIYGAINSAADWNGIKKGTYQNFAIVGDVNFDDIPKTDEIVTDLTFNKLLGIYKDYQNDDGSSEKRGPVIKNFDNTERGQIMGSGSALISEIKSESRYLNFDNIKLINNSGSTSGSYFGIIKYVSGEMYGRQSSDTISNEYIDFSNIYIDGKSGMSYVGCIAYNKSPYMQYVRGTNVEVHGGSYVGGLIGRSEKKPKYDLYGKNMVVIGTSYVGGLIGYDYGSSTKITYDIAVDGVYVSGTTYVGGAMGYGTSQQAAVIGRTDKLNGYTLNTVKGTSTYAGGIFGYLYYTSTKFYAENLNVSGSSYVGGIAGKNYYHLSEATAVNINVSATSNYAGGISGSASDPIYKSIVSGGSVNAPTGYAGGIVGSSSYNIYNCHVGPYKGTPTSVTGKYYIGGIVGYGSSSIYNNFTNANVTGEYSVGGIAGYGSSSIYRNIVGGSSITSTSSTSSKSSITSYSPRPDTAGKSFYMTYTGGLIGQMNTYSLGSYYNVINANITVKKNNTEISPTDTSYAGYGYYAGGYINSVYTSKYVYDYSTSPATRTTVYYYYDRSMPTGDMATYFPGQYVDSLKNTTYISSAGYPQMSENTTLNGVPIKDVTSHPMFSSVNYRNFSKKTDAQMRTISGSTYNSVTSFTAMPGETSNNLVYYPYASGLLIRYIDSDLFDALTPSMAYEVNSMLDVAAMIDTTTSASQTGGITSGGRPDYHVLPDFDVYASDVDKINIEFAEIDPYTYIRVNGESYSVKQNTFTFYYDFKEDFTVEIGDGINSKEVTISVDDVKNGITVIGEYYYYLENGEIITNQPRDLTKEDPEEETTTPVEGDSSNKIEEQIGEIIAEGVAYKSNSSVIAPLTSGISLNLKGEKRLDSSDTSKLVNNATNIYGDEVLLDNQDIYNINTGETKENSFENLTLVDSTKPLYEFTYANQKIQTYYNYSIIDGKYIDKQVYVKNGKLEVVDQNLESDNSAILIDSYNNKEFLVYLGTDGKLHSLKDDIEYPKNFKNINIKGISTNITSNTNMMIVEYKDGSKVIFNYITGQLISSHSDEPMSLEDYVKQYLEISSDELKGSSKTNTKYEAAKKLAEKLNQMPVEKVLNGDNYTGEGALLDQNKYTVVYDPIKKDYYVYEIPSEDDSGKIRLTESLSTSVDSVIDSNPILVKYYKGDSYSKISVVSSIIITIAVITGIAGAIVYLSKYFKKTKKKEA